MDSEQLNEHYTEELVGIVPDNNKTKKGEFIWDVYVDRPNSDNLVIGDFYSQEEAILYMLETFPYECNSENPPYALQRSSNSKIKAFSKLIKREIKYIKKIIRRLMELI